jgi:hypothetical protein
VWQDCGRKKEKSREVPGIGGEENVKGLILPAAATRSKINDFSFAGSHRSGPRGRRFESSRPDF